MVKIRFKRLAWGIVAVGVVAVAILVGHHWHSYRVLGFVETHRVQSNYHSYLDTLQQQDIQRLTLPQSELWELIEARKAPLILDVRSQVEYESGHIPGAVHLDYRELPEQLHELPAGKHEVIVTYCRTGVRAGVAEKTLHEAGFTSVVHLEGDMTGWLESGLPLN